MIAVATHVRVTCPICGTVDLDPSQVRLIQWRPDRGLAHFRCCGEDQLMTLKAQQIYALKRAGVHVVEMPERCKVDAPPLTEDDEIAFGLEMERS